MRRTLARLPGHAAPVRPAGRNGGRPATRPLLGAGLRARYDDEAVTKELQVLADHGLTLTRSALRWPELMPEPYRVDEAQLSRFGNFLDLHRHFGMRTLPLLPFSRTEAGPGWSAGRDRYTDVWLVGRQAWLAEQLACRFAGHPAVAGWLLPADTGPAPWVELVVRGLRAGGANQPVSDVDWVAARVHQAGDDQVRQHLRTAFGCELAGAGGRPVLVQELGAGGGPASEENLAHYYRQVLHTSLLGGATGWLAAAGPDPERPDRGTGPRAARGLTDASGQPTAALREMAGFRAVLDEVAVHQCTRAPADVCIVLPSHVDSGYPFTEPLERPVALGAAEQAYVACREAGTPPGLARESQGIGADCLLYLLPSLKQLTTSGWRRLEQLAYGGATVYVSYFAGVTDNQRGPWYADADRMFGVRHQLRYGLLDPVEPGPVRLTLRDDLGNLTAGTELSFATGTDPARRAYLPVEPIEAQVLATDQAGRPALLHRSVGAGAVMFCCYPLEAMAAAAPAVNPEDTWRLYAALGHAAGAHPVVRVDQPEVLVDCLDRDDGTRFVWLVSQASTPVAVTPRTQTGLPLRDLWSGALVSTVELPPFGVRVLRT